MEDPTNTDISSLRPVIARSWRRSVMSSVNPFKSMPDSVRDHQIDSQFLKLAEPIIRELEYLCLDTNGCVSLSDTSGTLALFRGSATSMRLADSIFPIAGGSMAEELVGTNSDGTAIEEGRAVQVWGAEHFNTALSDMCCTSIPIRDPFRRSIRGIISLSLPSTVVQNIDPRTILLIVQSAAIEIGNALKARLASSEQALMDEYLRESRKRGADIVVAMDSRITIANRDATQLLNPDDFNVLSAYANEAKSEEKSLLHVMTSKTDTPLRVHVRPASMDNPEAGSIIRISKPEIRPLVSVTNKYEQQPILFNGFIGNSPSLKRALEIASTVVRHQVPAYIVGEAGTGKKSLAFTIAKHLNMKAAYYDCGALGPGEQFSNEHFYADVNSKNFIIISNVESLAEESLRSLADSICQVSYPHIIFTFKTITEKILPIISAIKGMEINMPPLRMRRDDIPLLIKNMLSELSESKKIGAKLLSALTAADWPRNVSQLQDMVTASAMKATMSEIRMEDLSEVHRRELAKSTLSRLQRAELEQIVQALAEANGNRVKAAAILRIGRSTLYRKIDSYTVRGFIIEGE